MNNVVACTRCRTPFTDMRVEVNLETMVDRFRDDRDWESISNLTLHSREILCPECFYKFADLLQTLNIEMAATTSPLTGEKKLETINQEVESRVSSQPIDMDRSSFNTDEEKVLSEEVYCYDGDCVQTPPLFDESIRHQINTGEPQHTRGGDREISRNDMESVLPHITYKPKSQEPVNSSTFQKNHSNHNKRLLHTNTSH
jgi:hypothetical protein